jgi:hypothetical protein
MMNTRTLLTSTALALGALALTAVPANADSLSPRSTVASQADADETLTQQLGQLAKAVDAVDVLAVAGAIGQTLMKMKTEDLEKWHKALIETAEQVTEG